MNLGSKAELLILKPENSQHVHGLSHTYIAAYFFLGGGKKDGALQKNRNTSAYDGLALK